MGKVLTARNATIHTARAEIKTLTIEGKQVTLAVFRQLQRRDLIDHTTGELLGVPWGTVNYYWGDCAPDHLHVVWQDGEHLRRDCVPEKRPLCSREDAWVRDARVMVGRLVRAHYEWDLHGEGPDYPDRLVEFVHAGRRWQINAGQHHCWGCHSAGGNHAPWFTLGFGADRDARLFHDEARYYRIEHLAPLAAARQLAERAEAQEGATILANQKWSSAYEMLCRLDQLFIAV